MRLINYHHIIVTADIVEFVGNLTLTKQVGVIEDLEPDTSIENIRQEPFEQVLPDRFSRCLRREERNTTAISFHETLDQREADERLAKTDAIAEECAIVDPGLFKHRAVSVLLVLRQTGIHRRLFFPLPIREIFTFEQLLE